jgi:hypothetical protein
VAGAAAGSRRVPLHVPAGPGTPSAKSPAASAATASASRVFPTPARPDRPQSPAGASCRSAAGRLRHARYVWRKGIRDGYGARALWPRSVCSSRRGSRPARADGRAVHRAKLRRLTRRWITLAESRGSEGGSLWATHLTWTGNREGTTAWWESVEHCEGVDGAAAQGPCDMAKT